MTYDRTWIKVAVGVLVCVVVVGCTTVRRVDYGEASESALAEARPSADIPQWALGNIANDPVLDHEQFSYFVGISQEQATSEYEAVQQAYFDAVRRVADALTLRMQGIDTGASQAAADAEAKWPSHIRQGRGRTKDWDRDSEGSWIDDSENKLVRDAVMALAAVADMWVIREVGQQGQPIQNMMKYEELWKAKVLIRVPREELMRRMERIYEQACNAVDLENELSELELRLAVEIKEREAQLDYDTRRNTAGLDYDIRKANANLDWAIRKAEAEDRLTPAKVPQPTFHFMNNSYWYGYGPGVSDKVGVERVKLDVPK